MSQMVDPKFLFCVDHEKKELYILHRGFPNCLIHVRQEIPVLFIILDIYDEIDDFNDILTMPFFNEAKEFYKKYAEKVLPCN